MPREVTRATLDRIRVESAVSDDPDPAVAVRDLASALGTDAGLYLVFVTVPYALDGLARELTARWGERVIGCTCTRFFGPTATERGG